jgi:hypothetical protein
MKLTHSLYLLAIGAATFASCSKEESIEPGNNGGGGGAGTQALIGTYDFLYMAAHTESDITMTMAGETMRTVTISDYVSKQNTGIYEFTAKEMKSAGIGYTVDTVVKAWSYTNGQLDEEFEAPFTFSTTGYTSSGTYKLIGTDSIYSESGFASVPTGGGGQTNIPIEPSGTKFFWSGDTLTFYGQYAAVVTQTVQGMVVTSKQYAKHTTRLLKRK